MGRTGKLFTKVALFLASFLIVVVVGAVVAVNVSPRPFALLTNKMFEGGVGGIPKDLQLYREMSARVAVEKDIEYPSRFPSNRLDVFRPVDATGPLPTVLWVHGGGFVGGDKSDIDAWATMVAGHGFTVVSVNYALAPGANYPSPILQTIDAYRFVRENASRFPTADTTRLVIGGDSAGAQVASQFAAMQTNPQLAASMGIEAVVPKGELIGAVLYCGPYDLKRLYDGPSWFGRFFVRQMGWAYFGVKDWRDIPQAAQAATVDHVTAEYPPTFITDGNSGSFEEDARTLEARIRNQGGHVESLYFPLERARLPHEYQFDYTRPEALECLTRTLDFLNKISKRKE